MTRSSAVRRIVFIASVLLGIVGAPAVAPAHRAPPSPAPDGPVAAVLAPADGARLNAATLRVQALVAARKADRPGTFVFDGAAVQGRNAGHIERVDVAIDDIVVGQAVAYPCRRQLVVDLSVELGGFADGPHTLRITALQDSGRAAREATVTTTFTLDRTLPIAEINRIEAAATPAPFACFAARDEDDDEDDDAARPSHPDVHGRFVLGMQSDGADFTRDRLVIAAGGQALLLEPGMLRCNRRERVCRFDDPAHPLVQRLTLRRVGDRIVRFRLTGGPQWPRDAAVHLRIGNDSGGIDLGTGERLARMKPALDLANRAQATIGAAGGTVQTVVGGVVIRLDVPAGALTRDTLISVTPLVASPVPGNAAAHPGVNLEPAGLQFATPVTLTYDFGSQPVPATTRLFLVTSPLTKLPLGGVLDGSVLTAALWHFSVPQPGGSDPPLTDSVAWASAVLISPVPLTIAEMQSLLAIAADQQLAGCALDCLDLGAITTKVQESVTAATAAECANPATNASKAAIHRLLELEAVVQLVGGSVPTLLPCVDAMLGALITGLTGMPQSTAADDPYLVEAKDLGDTASRFNLPARAAEAFGKLAQGIRSVVIAIVTAALGASGTPEEEQLTAQAQTGIEQGQLWVTTIAPQTLGVDTGLPVFLQEALDSLQAGTMTVQNQMGEIRCRQFDEESPAPTFPIPPLVEVAPNVFTWSVEFGEPCASGTLEADVTFATAGTLTLTTNTAWFPPPVGQGGTFTVNGGFVAVGNLSTFQPLLCHRTSGFFGCAFLTQPEMTVGFFAGTYRFSFDAGYLNLINAGDRASGLILTIRFSPLP